METPNYSKLLERPRKGDAYIFRDMSVFKFPGDGNVVFQCSISLCDMESGAACTSMIPPNCAGGAEAAENRVPRSAPQIREGFSLTVNVETRTLNVIENESIRPPTPAKYCDIR
ncbi:unnamed protein product [Anisakis simplex]|uniref:ZP domain-containing protein n=1 Tax=Anisakis simplex TaxID=6269 RepID=A0A3P6RMW8_ANISI|nr:unnamed protein product [Anisakis simplex]